MLCQTIFAASVARKARDVVIAGGGVGVLRATIKVTEIALFAMSTHHFLLAFHCNDVPILHLFRDTAIYW